jgi:hypothetical protein
VYSALTDLICAAVVFVLAALLFAVSVAVVMTAEGLNKLLGERLRARPAPAPCWHRLRASAWSEWEAATNG